MLWITNTYGMQVGMQFWLGFTQPLGMVCMKGRGTALRPRADLGAREEDMALEPPPALVSPIPLCPRYSCFPQQDLPWVTCTGGGERGWMDRGGWGGGWSACGQRLCCDGGTTCACGCAAASSPCPCPLPMQGLHLSHRQGWGHGPRGAALQWRQTFCLDPWQVEPAGLVAAAGESGAAVGILPGSLAGLGEGRGEQGCLRCGVGIIGFLWGEEDRLHVRSGEGG